MSIGRSSEESAPEHETADGRSDDYGGVGRPSDALPSLGGEARFAERRKFHATAFAVVACGTGWMSAAVHFSTGADQRALFTAVFGSLFGLLALGLRSKPRMGPLAAHLILALSAVGLILSPITSTDSIPIFLGLATVPFAATMITTYRGGLVWTAICVIILMISAAFLPLDTSAKPLAWNAAIVALLIGTASAWIDRSRERAETNADRAHFVADREATSRSRAEARLKQREALLATIFRRTPAILVLYDVSKHSIVEINERCARIVGWEREAAIGRSLSELDIWTNPKDAKRLFDEVRSSDAPATIETQIQTRSGTPIDVLATVEWTEIDDRPHVLINALDISEQKRARERDRNDLQQTVEDQNVALKISRSQLQRQHRLASIGTLASGIAHEINNPVGAIRMAAEVELAALDKNHPPAPGLRASLMRIIDESDRCGEIVRGVLQFSRDEPMSKRAGDLNNAVIRSCQNVRSYLARLRDTRLEVNLSDESLPVMMSSVGIDQIVSNLLRNAAESADSVRIRVETARDGNFAILTIIDNGQGMDESVIRRAFDPFFTTRLGQGGTGLGLSIVHGLARDHGSTVTVDSSIGHGTTVRLQFPLFEE